MQYTKRRRLLTLAKVERKRRLSLLLDILLGSFGTVGSGSLCVFDCGIRLLEKRSIRCHRRNHWSGSISGRLAVLLNSTLSRLIGDLLFFLSEDVAKDAVAFRKSWLFFCSSGGLSLNSWGFLCLGSIGLNGGLSGLRGNDLFSL
ncbi:hypothetical protein VCV18_003915 [Metarhizium anisopliae]